MQKKTVFEGRRKILFMGPEPGLLIQHFKDIGDDCGAGALDSRISCFLMMKLAEIGIPTHFIRRLNMREQVVHSVEAFPVIVCLRNIASGSFAERYDVEEGTVLSRPIVEFFYKKRGDSKIYPLVTEDHIRGLSWIGEDDFHEIVALSLRANDFLLGVFLRSGLRLCDVRFEFGRYFNQNSDESRILLIDEIAPDSFRVKDPESGVYYSRDPNGECTSIHRKEIARRLGILCGAGFDSEQEQEEQSNNWLCFFKK